MLSFRPTALALCAVLFTSSPALAGPAEDLKALLEAGKPAEAYALGQQHPDSLGDPNFDFYFAIAAIDGGHAAEGVLAMERYLLNFPDNLSARVELARGYYVMGDDARAREEFEALKKGGLPADLAAVADRFLDAIAARQSRYQLSASAFVELGYGYDSNVNGGIDGATVNLPGFGTVLVAPGSQAQRSPFAQGTAGAALSAPIHPGVTWFVALQGDIKSHGDTGARVFDNDSRSVVSGFTILRDKNQLRLFYNFSDQRIENDLFRTTDGVGVEYSRQIDETQSASAFFQHNRIDYAPANTLRDADFDVGGVSWRRAFARDWAPVLAVSAYYGKEDNHAGITNLERDVWGARLAVSATPRPRWSVGAGLSLQRSDYQAPSIGTTTREDEYWALDFTAAYQFTRNLSVRGEALISGNESNLDIFQYNRELAAVKVRYEFK